jgi:hypothetical protein
MSEFSQRVRRLERFFKQRSFVSDSPGITSERMKNGRVQINAKRAAAAVAPSAEAVIARLQCNGGRGGTLIVLSAGMVEVQILEKNPAAILTDEIWILSPSNVFIGNNDATGTVQRFGPFSAGTELIFGIKTHDFVTGFNPGNWTYSMGAASRNPDGLFHCDVDCAYAPGETAEVGFEDLYGNLMSPPWVDPGNPNAGDNSYNDARILVSLL